MATPRKVMDEEVAALAVEAVRSKQGTIRSASAKLGSSKNSLARVLSGQVEMRGRPGPPTVLSVEEEAAIEDLEYLLVFVGSHRSGLTRAQLGEAVCKLCNHGRLVPRDPEKGPGKAWFIALVKRHPGLFATQQPHL